jgi:hypothetical protein
LKRRLLNVSALVAAALCVGLVALAVRSYWFEDYFVFHAGHSGFDIVSVNGEIEVNLSGRGPQSNNIAHIRQPAQRVLFSYWKMTRFDFGYQSWPQIRRVPFMVSVMLPNWAMAAPLGCLAWWLRRKARKLTPRTGFAVETTEKLAETSN